MNAYELGLLIGGMSKKSADEATPLPVDVRSQPQRPFLESLVRLAAPVGGAALGDTALRDVMRVPGTEMQRFNEAIRHARSSKWRNKMLSLRGAKIRNARLGRWGIGAALASMLAQGLMG